MAMTEFVDPSQQPADNPSRRSEWIRVSDSHLPVLEPPLDEDYVIDLARPSRQVRVVWDDRTGEIGAAGVWNAKAQAYDTVRPTGGRAAEVREAFADFLAEGVVDEIWPVSSTGMRPPASSELLTVAKRLLDPRQLAAGLIGATVQVAAVHAGIQLSAARSMGKSAKAWFAALSSPRQGVQYADLVLSVGGSLTNDPALQDAAADQLADAIDELLGPGAPPPRPTDEAAS